MNKNKREELEWLIGEHDIDILGITESWTNADIGDAEINFKGFTMYCQDRKVEGRNGQEEYYFISGNP